MNAKSQTDSRLHQSDVIKPTKLVAAVTGRPRIIINATHVVLRAFLMHLLYVKGIFKVAATAAANLFALSICESNHRSGPYTTKKSAQ